MPDQSPAKTAYAAYRAANSRLVPDAEPLPTWDLLGESEQIAWTVAVGAAITAVEPAIHAQAMARVILGEPS